jgi:hypothetical protein
MQFFIFRSYARTSAYLAYDPENNNLPKHIYFQSTPDHVLSVDYSPWLDAALLCDSNGREEKKCLIYGKINHFS